MAKTFIQAVKYVTGQGWVKCEPHQARQWEARIGARLLGRYPAKWQAVEVLENAEKRRIGLARFYQLGKRMEPKPEGMGSYAVSLTRDQFNKREKN